MRKTPRTKRVNRVLRTLTLLRTREKEKAIELRELARRSDIHARNASYALTEVRRLIQAGVFAVLLLATAAQAGDHRRRCAQREQSHNYIIERQEAYQVQGTPVGRIYSGKREIDIYRSGEMFERNNLVGVKK